MDHATAPHSEDSSLIRSKHCNALPCSKPIGRIYRLRSAIHRLASYLAYVPPSAQIGVGDRSKKCRGNCLPLPLLAIERRLPARGANRVPLTCDQSVLLKCCRTHASYLGSIDFLEGAVSPPDNALLDRGPTVQLDSKLESCFWQLPQHLHNVVRCDQCLVFLPMQQECEMYLN